MAKDAIVRHRPYPAHNLQTALQIISAIVESGASRPMDRLLVAQAINRTPSSSEFKKLLSSSLKYGLTEGTEKADVIKPTPLGLKISKPLNDAEKSDALVRAARTPELLGQIYAHFNKQKLPRVEFLKNVLARQFDVDDEHTEELANLVIDNARFVGFLQTIGGSEYINFDAIEISSSEPSGGRRDDTDEVASPIERQDIVPIEAGIKAKEPEKPRRIFVAHGKKHAPLKEIQAVLNKFKIPFVVAQEEAHAGRPISTKVAEIMNECSAGLFIFTKDEEFFDKDGNSVWRPSENVVFELGAGSMMWGKKIIVLKEDGVNFASDYRDLGYITFQDGHVSSIGMQLFMELIAFEFIKVEAA